MIITEAKNKEQILKSLAHDKSIFVIGCGRCATSCETGGEKQVAEMVEFLKSSGKEITGSKLIEAPCDERLVIRDHASNKSEIEKADAVLVLSCGAGVQVVSEVSGKNVIPALDSMFLGKTKRHGKFSELCIMCGDCLLEDTGGICPTSRCSKGLLNGPCGGSHNGKCEVNESYDCGWYLIFEKLKKLGKLDKIKELRKPKDYSRVIRPRKVETR